MTEPAATPTPVTGRTRWGIVALAGVLAFYLPIYLVLGLSRLGVPLRKRIVDEAGWVVFDFGIWSSMLLLLVCLIGLTDLRSRRLSAVALVLLIVAFFGTFLL